MIFILRHLYTIGKTTIYLILLQPILGTLQLWIKQPCMHTILRANDDPAPTLHGGGGNNNDYLMRYSITSFSYMLTDVYLSQSHTTFLVTEDAEDCSEELCPVHNPVRLHHRNSQSQLTQM